MIELYPEYQAPAFKKLVKHFVKNVVGLMVMATGLGKTIVAAFWAKREYKKGRKGLFLCHDTGILDQAMDEFQKVFGRKVSLKTFFGSDKDWDADKGDIVFATFQTLRESNPFFKDEFDFIIVDESHHAQADTYKKVIEYFNPKKLLGITATPNREDEQDIREIFGDEVVNIPLEEAMAKGWLSQVEYHILNDNLSHWKLKKIVKEVLEEGRRISRKQLNETIFVKARDEVTAQTIQEYAIGNKKAIIFCESIPHADNFQKFLPNAQVYHSEKSEKYNHKVLQDFREGNIQYILTINKMNEGIHVSDAEIIVFLRCTDSKTIFFQQLGRGLEKPLNKKKVIVLDFVANCDRVAMIKEFSREIKKRAGNNFELTKDVLHVTGKAFDFIFNDEQIDILEVIRKITTKIYVSDIPHLLAEYSLKNDLLADQVIAGTNKKLWWVCSACKYEWQAPGNNRVTGIGCPACSGRVATRTNNITVTHPELTKEYSSENELLADQIKSGSSKKVSWICSKCEHEWQAVVNSRTSGCGCPSCRGMVVTKANNLAVTHPDLAKEYSPKNKLPANQVIAGTGKKLWWICSKCEHEWQTTGDSRSKQGTGCLACLRRIATKANNLAVTHPDLAKEYSSKNKSSADHVISGSHAKLWWICSKCEHEWQAPVRRRAGGSGCPACANQVVTDKNNLTVTHPNLAKEYSPKNKLPANQVIAGTGKKLWWICSKCEHEWQATGANRRTGRGCPECKRCNSRKKKKS
ncbi:MAG: zinc-ribbon domain-containing protein [Candidatus Moraniibacteriota bacterium]|jgi:superfamily II DNA or RNA helicase/DNA-directed RNA polymerase subunit RPC12/RpoP